LIKSFPNGTASPTLTHVDPEPAALVPTYLSGDFAEIAGQGMARTTANWRSPSRRGHPMTAFGTAGLREDIKAFID
jgi:hypothetical protein